MKPDWKHLGVGEKIKKYNEKAMSMRLIHNDILLCACRRLNDYNGRFVNYIFCL